MFVQTFQFVQINGSNNCYDIYVQKGYISQEVYYNIKALKLIRYSWKNKDTSSKTNQSLLQQFKYKT